MIFEDPTRFRWRVFLAIALGVAGAVFATVRIIVHSVFSDVVLASAPVAVSPVSETEIVRTPFAGDEEFHEARAVAAHGPRFPAPFSGGRLARCVFLVQADTTAVSRLAEIGASLDVVFPDYFRVSGLDGTVEKTIRPAARDQLEAIGAAIMPRVANTDAEGNWSADAVSALLRDPLARLNFTESLLAALKACDAHGVNIDFENLYPEDSKLFVEYLDELAGALHWFDMYLTVDVPVEEEQYDYEAIAGVSDAVILMAYDQSYAGGTPGPIAGDEWFREQVAGYASRIPSEKLIVAIGAYGYDWKGGEPASTVTFDEFLALASRHRAKIETDGSINSTLHYFDPSGARHTVVTLDAVTAWNQCAFVAGLGERDGAGRPAGLAVWRLGTEDPAIWSFLLRDSPESFDPATLAVLEPRTGVEFRGDGVFYRVMSREVEGDRWLSFSGRFIEHAEYHTLPRTYRVDRAGQTEERLIALTFDDGPDPVWTPRLLDLLKRESVPAAFFVVGELAAGHPELIRRELAEGHTVGSHTYTHPRIDRISGTALRMELNQTARAIEMISGRQALLFRPPYDVDYHPTAAEQLEPLAQVAAMGYTCVGADLGAEDYLRLPAPILVQRLVERMGPTGGHVICLHDAGGDRSRTVEAVAQLIPQLRAEGFRFVGLPEFIGAPAGSLNPAIPAVEAAAAEEAGYAAGVRSITWRVVSVIFISSTVVAIIRIASLGVIVLLQHRDARRGKLAIARPYCEPITVVVPAYNEAKVIRRTLEGILASTYPAIQVLVVDDGSSDETADIVADMAEADPRVRVLCKANGGKSSALNLGFRSAETEIVVILDADTIVLPGTLAALVGPFADPEIDAVCGNVQVGNVRNLLTALQDVEYVTCQNYDRRAFDRLNCIGVVPGATGAWRRRVVLEAGGYSHDTLTEDADLTLEVLRRGGRIVYAPEARSITEAPETVRALYRQRFRWSFGTFQTLWKHRAAFWNGTLGWVGMPNLMIFQLIFPMLAPIGDAVLLYCIVRGEWNAFVSGYFTFLGMDVLGSAVAFKLDQRRLWGIWTVLIQRFCYRQFMYVVTFSALIACIRGRRHGWNKLERLASVLVPVHQPLGEIAMQAATVNDAAVESEAEAIS